jgi:threonyl-tRNA synthetase
MIHRAVLGSVERFIMVIIEHFSGAFPVWLAPVQVKILPISEKHLDYAKEINTKLKAENIRSEVDARSETLGAKIRDAQNEKVPYMIILGDKEVEANQVSVRTRDGANMNSKDIDEIVGTILGKIKNKSLEL